MTELHNMSVPSRSVLTVQRTLVPGRRFRVLLLDESNVADVGTADLTSLFRRHGLACAAALIASRKGRPSMAEMKERIRKARKDAALLGRTRAECERVVLALDVPACLGFFSDEPSPPASPRVLSGAAAIAVLAARSGPLYLPGRFEPSLICAGATTLFFPEGRGVV